MGGYLARLVSRGATPASMAPVVRSASPIADADQRAGMFGLDAVPAMESPVEGMDDPGPPPPAPPGETQSSRATAPTAAPAPRVRPQAMPTTSRTAAVHPPGGTERTNVAVAGADSETSPRQLDRVEQARPPTEPAPGITPSTFEPAPRASIDRTTNAGLERTGRERSADQRNIDARRMETTPRLEPLPRSAEALSAMSTGSTERTAEPDAPAAPSLTIGSINVEVVPPAVEPAPAPPAQQGPLTAASVSVIGPLSPRVRGHRHSSLRYR